MSGFLRIGFLGLIFGVSSLWGRLVWSDLDQFQRQWTDTAFIEQMDQVYAPYADWRSWVDLFEGRAEIRMDDVSPFARYVYYFRPEAVEEPLKVDAKRLKGLRVVIDPGHLGGPWGLMEGRSFVIGEDTRGLVQEGDLTLAVGQVLMRELEELGVSVVLTRDSSEPVTTIRPEGLLPEDWESSVGSEASRKAYLQTVERQFYRVAEIQARAQVINDIYHPDLVICLHFNAEGWGPNGMSEPVERSHGHILVNGTYQDDELAREDVRLALFWRLFSGASQMEIPLAQSMAQAMETATGLAPYSYRGRNAIEINGSRYVWARNLMANRIYQSPVVYLEPWVANEADTYEWIQAGNFEGTQMINGRERASIVRTYVRFVVQGIVDYFDSESP